MPRSSRSRAIPIAPRKPGNVLRKKPNNAAEDKHHDQTSETQDSQARLSDLRQATARPRSASHCSVRNSNLLVERHSACHLRVHRRNAGHHARRLRDANRRRDATTTAELAATRLRTHYRRRTTLLTAKSNSNGGPQAPVLFVGTPPSNRKRHPAVTNAPVTPTPDHAGKQNHGPLFDPPEARSNIGDALRPDTFRQPRRTGAVKGCNRDSGARPRARPLTAPSTVARPPTSSPPQIPHPCAWQELSPHQHPAGNNYGFLSAVTTRAHVPLVRTQTPKLKRHRPAPAHRS